VFCCAFLFFDLFFSACLTVVVGFLIVPMILTTVATYRGLM